MAETGKAAIFTGPNKPFDIRTFPLPKLDPGSMLVKISMSNICGSDLHIYRGDMAKFGFDGSRESILGHEMAGRVHALGEGMTSDSLGRPLKEGDRVVYQYFQPCWRCPVCLSGATRACPNKYNRRATAVGEWPYFTGGYGEYYYVPPGRAVFKVEDERIPDTLIASVNCAFCQVTQGWETIGLRFGQSAVIQGAGGLGLFATVVAKEMGAAPIIVVDAQESRLALAKEFGADHVIDASKTKPADRVAQVKSLTGGLGAEVVAELVGFPTVVQEGLDMVRSGGRYLEIGNINFGMTMPYDPSQLVHGNKSIHGVVLYEPKVIPQVLSFISRNLTKYPFEKVVSHVYPLDKINDAFQQSEWLGKDQRKVVRAALAP